MTRAGRPRGGDDGQLVAMAHRVEVEPGDVDAWIRLTTLRWRAHGWEAARETMHRGWAKVRDDPGRADRFRQLLVSTFQIVGDPTIHRTSPLRCFEPLGEASDRLLLAGADCAGEVFDRASGRRVARLPGFHMGVWSLTPDPSQRFAVVIGSGREVQLWDLEAARPLPLETRRWVRDWAPEVLGSLSTGARWFAFTDLVNLRVGRGATCVLDLPGGQAPLQLALVAARFLEGDRLAGFRGDRLELYDPEDGSLLGQARVGARPLVRHSHAAATRDGGRWLVVDRDGAVRLAEVTPPLARGGASRARLTTVLAPDAEAVVGATLSEDGRRVALSDEAGEVRVLDADSGAALEHIDELDERARVLRFLPGTQLLAVSQRRHLRLFPCGG